MNKLIAMTSALLITACASAPRRETIAAEPAMKSAEETQAEIESRVQTQLGMNRLASDLGYSETRFNPCEHNAKPANGSCAPRILTVLHFQLKCRDSVGTVSQTPTEFTALSAEKVLWSLGGRTGSTRTDTEGYGAVVMISDKSAKGRQLVLRIGKQFMGFTASELTKVVLPSNFCG